MKIIKSGDRYLGWVDAQGDAIRVPDALANAAVLAVQDHTVDARIVKLKTRQRDTET